MYLPLEIRRLIWIASIVPRRFKASMHYYIAEEGSRELLGFLESNMQNPATLYACAESRKTVGEVYRVLMGASEGHLKFFNPTRDTLVLNNCKFWLCGKYINGMSLWMKHKFNHIRWLEIGGLWLEPIIYDGMLTLLLDLDIPMGGVTKEEMEEAVVSEYFSSLEELTLRAGRYSGLLLDEGNVELATAMVERFMEMKAERVDGFKVPEVVLDLKGGLRGHPPVRDPQGVVQF